MTPDFTLIWPLSCLKDGVHLSPLDTSLLCSTKHPRNARWTTRAVWFSAALRRLHTVALRSIFAPPFSQAHRRLSSSCYLRCMPSNDRPAKRRSCPQPASVPLSRREAFTRAATFAAVAFGFLTDIKTWITQRQPRDVQISGGTSHEISGGGIVTVGRSRIGGPDKIG